MGAIGNLIQGFTVLSLDALGKCPASTTKKLEPSLLGSLGETMVYDVSKLKSYYRLLFLVECEEFGTMLAFLLLRSAVHS